MDGGRVKRERKARREKKTLDDLVRLMGAGMTHATATRRRRRTMEGDGFPYVLGDVRHSDKRKRQIP